MTMNLFFIIIIILFVMAWIGFDVTVTTDARHIISEITKLEDKIRQLEKTIDEITK